MEIEVIVLQPSTNRYFHFLNLWNCPRLNIVSAGHVNDSRMGQGQDNSVDGLEFSIEPNATILASTDVRCVGCVVLLKDEMSCLT